MHMPQHPTQSVLLIIMVPVLIIIILCELLLDSIHHGYNIAGYCSITKIYKGVDTLKTSLHYSATLLRTLYEKIQLTLVL